MRLLCLQGYIHILSILKPHNFPSDTSLELLVAFSIWTPTPLTPTASWKFLFGTQPELREFGMLDNYYHIRKCSVSCESFRRALRKWNLKLALHSLSIPPIGIKKRPARCECKWSSEASYPTQMFDSNQNCHVSPKLTRNKPFGGRQTPQDGQPFLKATHKYLRKTYRLWVSDPRFLATSVLCLWPHNLPSALKPDTR